MRFKFISIIVLYFIINQLFAVTYEWGKVKDYRLHDGENLMSVRFPIILNKNRVIEVGYKDNSETKKSEAIYWILKPNFKGELKLQKKIEADELKNISKSELGKLYSRAKKYKSRTAFRGVDINGTNRFIELVFSWYSTNENAIYRFAELNDENEITWKEFKDFSLNKDGSIYNSDFAVTKNNYILGTISVLVDVKDEDYNCYYNIGKIKDDEIDWKYDSFNKVLSWAKHEILLCSLKDSYILICSDPASVHQKYSICRISGEGRLILGGANNFDDFSVTHDPAYISDLDLIVFPGEYKKDGKIVKATATYKIDYENKKLKDKVLQELPACGDENEFPGIDYLPEDNLLLLTNHHHDPAKYYYALAEIKK